MDPSLYKDTVTSRGFTYHYYHSPPAPGKPTLLFLHGFPSSSYDWHRQVEYFQPKGYGLIVPDCLGAGRTSKPENLEAFAYALIARDIAEVLDAAGVEKVVGIGHDWGSIILSRMANLFSERFYGFAWVAASYIPPRTEATDLDAWIAQNRAATGDDQVGYWKQFVQEDAHKLCEQNIDSFLQLLYPAKPEVWLEWLTPSWKSKEWVQANRTPGRPAWLSEEEYKVLRETLVQSGLKSPLSYYRAFSADNNVEEDRKIPQDALQIRKPALFIATSRDYVCTPRNGRASMAKFAPHAKIVELNVGHWVQLEATDEFNRVLEDWIQSLPLSGN
ncbi:alpha/beta-hydrolase [Trametes sanguinea]|nr:alpha/beta-hydrolase [Trametes sanguinea]